MKKTREQKLAEMEENADREARKLTAVVRNNKGETLEVVVLSKEAPLSGLIKKYATRKEEEMNSIELQE